MRARQSQAKKRKTISISPDALRQAADLKKLHRRTFSNLIEFLVDQEAQRTRAQS